VTPAFRGRVSDHAAADLDGTSRAGQLHPQADLGVEGPRLVALDEGRVTADVAESSGVIGPPRQHSYGDIDNDARMAAPVFVQGGTPLRRSS